MKKLYIYLFSLVVLTATTLGNSMLAPLHIHGLDPKLMYAICKVESNCNQFAVNHSDGNKSQKARGITSKSYGMFQIKLSTAKSLGFTGTVEELMRPEVNAFYASRLLTNLLVKHKTLPKALSAYNAGKPSKHNKNYVNKVLLTYNDLKQNKVQ